MTPTYSEVIYETQSSFVVHERAGPGRVLKSAVDLPWPGRFDLQHDPGASGLDSHSAACGSGQPVHDPAAGFLQQWLGDAAADRFKHAHEVTPGSR